MGLIRSTICDQPCLAFLKFCVGIDDKNTDLLFGMMYVGDPEVKTFSYTENEAASSSARKTDRRIAAGYHHPILLLHLPGKTKLKAKKNSLEMKYLQLSSKSLPLCQATTKPTDL